MGEVMQAAYRHALVLGLGASGEAAALLLHAEGAAVTVVDAADTADLQPRAAALRGAGVTVVTGAASLPQDRFDVCIVSPGVPADAAWVLDLRKAGVPVLSELELGARRSRSRLLALTGSNGKSTLARLCGDILTRAGFAVEVGANYGRPLCSLVRQNPPPDWIVAEVSTFQLEHVEQFRPTVAILLNVHPNHLDRHGSLAVYAALKDSIFANQGAGDTAVAPADRRAATAAAAGRGAVVAGFGLDAKADYRYRPGGVTWGGPDGGEISLCDTLFDNPVLGLTAAAACAATLACGATPAAIVAATRAFQPLPHRLQLVAECGGVRFVDDSKATNLAAMTAALERIAGGVRLIAGGLLKEHELEGVKEVLAKRVRKVYLIGQSSPAMAEAWRDVVACVVCGTLDRAVLEAKRDALPGETVLLSPACASFDQFRNYGERGDRFRQMVESEREEK